MTAPNMHLPGQIRSLSRHTLNRQCLMVNGPDNQAQNDIGYIFLLEAINRAQEIYAFCALNDGYQAVVGDMTGLVSKFAQDAHHHLTKTTNKRLGRRGSMFPREQMGNTFIADAESAFDAMVEVWTLPIALGLVDDLEEWTNFMIRPENFGKPMRFKRPAYFSDDGSKPEWVEYTPMPPECLRHIPLDELVRHSNEAIEERRQELLAQRAGEPCLGKEKCQAISPFSTNSDEVPEPAPSFTTRCVTRAKELLSALRQFRKRMRVCITEFRLGEHVTFPAGTVKMRLLFNVPCEPISRGHPFAPSYESLEISFFGLTPEA